VSVNGKRLEGEIVPGKFLPVRRTWKGGDRVEFEIGMPLRLQAVDAQNPDIVALVRGAISLFAIGEVPAKISRSQLLAATSVAQGSQDWLVRSDTQKLTLRPFAAIGDETYRLYHKVEV
jgi:DUF1680 family protein